MADKDHSYLDKSIISPVLVGREQEVETLKHALIAAKQGTGRCFTLVGEAGVGKSRLLAALRRRAEGEGFLILQGHCFEPDLTFPYAPLIDALRAFFAVQSTSQIGDWFGPLAAELIKLLPELALKLPDLQATPPLDPESEKRRLFETLAQFLTGLTASRPGLIIMEDVHWSDETSLDFLHYFARRLPNFPVLLVASYRTEEMTPALNQTLTLLNRQRLAQEINLKRLQRDETEAMLRAIFELNRPVRAEFLDTIFALTEGNPFFIEEVVKSLISAGDIFYTRHGWDRKPIPDLHIPASVQDAVQQRLAQLSRPARQGLTLAAVAGRRFDFTLLQVLTDTDEAGLLNLIKEMMTAQFVIEESAERFAFRHALTRQAIYANLLARERQTLHHTIAQTIERLYPEAEPLEQQAADLAYHFYEAAVWDKALTYGQQAAERAQHLYAPGAAVDHYSRAIQAAQRLNLAPAAHLYRARSQAYQTIGVFEPAYADLETALKATQAGGDDRLTWQILLEMGMLWVSRDYARAGDYFDQALELARAMGDPVTVAHSLNRLGNYLANIEQPLQALPHHQEALAIFERLQDPAGRAETLDLLGTTLVVGGDWVQGAAHYQQAAALFRHLDNRQGLVSSLTMLTFRGGAYLNETTVMAATFSEAAQDGEMALEVAAQTGQLAAESVAASALAFSLGPQGQYNRALSLAQTGLDIAEQLEHRHWLTFGHLALGALYLDLLATAAARQHLEQALTLAQDVGSRFFHNLASGFLGSACILDNDLARAEAILKAATPAMQELEAHPPSTSRGQLWRARIELALAQNDFKLALQIIDRLVTLAPNLADGVVIPRLWSLRGQALMGLDNLSAAETTLVKAQQSAAAQGAKSLLWRIQSGLAQLYLRQRRRSQAEAALLEAQTLIEELATNVSDDMIRENFVSRAFKLLPELSPLTPRRAAKRAYGGLTRRERQVAALVAQGKSNREIAEALIVSERTAATHVGNILNKLGYSSRAQIAGWAVEKGLLKEE